MASLIKRSFQSGDVYYIQYWLGGKQKRRRAHESYQISKQMLRDFENDLAKGEETPLPTHTPIAEIVAAYVAHLHEVKTDKSAQTDIYYLRDLFGPICEALKVNKDIQAVQRRGNERLKLLGVIVASVDKRTRLAVALRHISIFLD